MKVEIIELQEVDSTNNYLTKYKSADQADLVVAVADYQSAGRGQGTNRWESERGKNLLFSMLIHPVMVPVARQFLLSMAGALALKMAIGSYVDDITLKWGMSAKTESGIVFYSENSPYQNVLLRPVIDITY
jgi:BirA family biotin operon repressor/biotin-[acetyl-CoA-carboxylase] ligase